MKYASLAILWALAVGCGSGVAPGLESPDTQWWEQSGPVGEGLDMSVTEPPSMEDKFWFVNLGYSESTPTMGSQTFSWHQNGANLCNVRYSLEEPTPVALCDECIEAWSFTLGEPSVSIDRDDACTSWGVVEFGGTPFLAGFSETHFYYQSNEIWVLGGEFERDNESLYFEMSLE